MVRRSRRSEPRTFTKPGDGELVKASQAYESDYSGAAGYS